MQQFAQLRRTLRHRHLRSSGFLPHSLRGYAMMESRTCLLAESSGGRRRGDCVAVVDQVRPESGPSWTLGPRWALCGGSWKRRVYQARERSDGRTLPTRGRRSTHGRAHLYWRGRRQLSAARRHSPQPSPRRVESATPAGAGPPPAPPIPRGYAIWSEGLLAEAFACFPTTAFPALCERLRSATAHQDTSRLYKALTMWGDRFATALSAWLASDTLRVQARAIHGLTLYAKGLNALCDVETPSLASCLHQINYPELVRFHARLGPGCRPRGPALWTPRHALAHQVGLLVVETVDEARRIAMLRCLSRLCVPHQPVPALVDTLVTLAAEADSPRWSGKPSSRCAISTVRRPVRICGSIGSPGHRSAPWRPNSWAWRGRPRPLSSCWCSWGTPRRTPAAKPWRLWHRLPQRTPCAS